MGGERGRLTTARESELGQPRVRSAASHFGEGVAVEEEERRAAMAVEEEFEQFAERQLPLSGFFPSSSDSLMSFSIMAVLSASSLARSSVEAVDKLPTPVLDKSGSDL